MAVTAPVSFSKVRTEFGAGSAYLSAYVRGGAYVPNGPAANANISTTAAGLQLSQFEGAVAIVNHTGTTTGNVSGSCSTTLASCSATTSSCTASVTSGGSGSYTYAWSYVSGDTFTVNSPNSATTTFSKNSGATGTVEGPPNVYTGTYRCTITDTGNGNYQTTHDITVTTSHYRVAV